MKQYSIIPKPVLTKHENGCFQCSGLPEITECKAFPGETQVFSDQMRRTYGDEAFARDSGAIRLLKNESLMAEESYRLEIAPEGITVSAGTEVGVYRGLQTLRQLFLSEYSEGVLSIPCGIIEDRPRFPWRGFMLDCSRHFYSIDFVKKLLDALSLHHINIFHWHLTDDQGWRFPVSKYPLLTEIGSYRKDRRMSWISSIGGFYSKEEIRDIVSFAASRHIEIVPEVDLPGHASAILAAYPDLGCTGGPYQVEERYGIFEDVLCAGNDDIFPLAEAVFDTLAELFPSGYVHIGGDEVLFKRWAECPKCKKRLAELGLTEPAQLQSWITSRLAQMLKRRGKTAIGWDEVLENTEKFPPPEDIIVQSWRGKKGGKKASSLGHRVIMSPNTEGCYLDYKHFNESEEPGQLFEGSASVYKSYSMDPVTPEMTGEEAARIMGGQGNMWSELIYAGKIAEYMIFPRICAIAETLWTPKENKDFDDFSTRLTVHQKRLDCLGLLQYRGALR